MADERGPSGGRPRSRTPTPAERRERRGTVEDPAEVLDAGARFLEARPRSVDEVRRRLLRLGYRARPGRGGHRPPDRPALPRRRRVRPGLGRVAGPGEAARRARAPARARAEGRGPGVVAEVLEDRRASPAPGRARRTATTEPPSPDDAAAERLLRRRLPAILREADPRRRRQRAYALLARGGFSPDVCSAVSRRLLDDGAARRRARDADTGSGRDRTPVRPGTAAVDRPRATVRLATPLPPGHADERLASRFRSEDVGCAANRTRTQGPPPGEPRSSAESGWSLPGPSRSRAQANADAA